MTGIVSVSLQLEFSDDEYENEVTEAMETLRSAGFEVVDYEILDHEVLG